MAENDFFVIKTPFKTRFGGGRAGLGGAAGAVEGGGGGGGIYCFRSLRNTLLCTTWDTVPALYPGLLTANFFRFFGDPTSEEPSTLDG